MSSKLQFLQAHCLIMKLVLFHGPGSASNELLWNSHITSELSKICKVLYAKPTFSRIENTFANQDAKIDLVLSGYDTGQLSTVLFNVKGITMREPPLIRNDLMCPAIEDYFELEQSNKALEDLRGPLIRKWNAFKHSQELTRGGKVSSVAVEPWVFNTRPVKKILTSENQLVGFNSKSQTNSQYDMKDRRGSRFFQDEPSTGYDRNTVNFKMRRPPDEVSSEHFLALKPVIYESLDSMPLRLQKWLRGAVEDDFTTNEAEQARLDLMLHGFKGFN